MNIGVIGVGYVGKAVVSSYPRHKIYINDPKYSTEKNYVSVSAMADIVDAVFVCVPTPQDQNGACETAILSGVLEQLLNLGYHKPVIVKSTAPPVFYQQWQQRMPNLAHVPEFLTAARAEFDYVNPHKIVVGCAPELHSTVADVLMASMINFERVRIEYCSIAEAAFFKYLANNMLAIKVVVNNEFAELASKLGIDWQVVSNIAKTDSRLGNTHWQVPGTDGQKGFGGACFPKDTSAIIYQATQAGADVSVLSAAVAKNKQLRK